MLEKATCMLLFFSDRCPTYIHYNKKLQVAIPCHSTAQCLFLFLV